MCGYCFTREYYSFPSYQAFETFDMQLTQQLQRPNGLRYSSGNKANGFRKYSLYFCAACRNTWALSEPDNAWRGFFLHESQAIAHLNKLGLIDKARGYVGLILLVAALLGLVNWLMQQ